jgi:hypothetical protein
MQIIPILKNDVYIMDVKYINLKNNIKIDPSTYESY